MTVGTPVKTLVLPFEPLRTLYEGPSEVRLYRNEVTDALHVGKRIDVMGLEEALSVNEAKLLQDIRHDNIVPVFDVAEVPEFKPPMKVIEMIMPYYPRGSICDAFARGEQFGLGNACLLTQAGLRGLGELHEVYGILHRDVKSPNLLLEDDGHLLRVGDLGVAVRMNSGGTAPSFKGAHPYLPPETYTSGIVNRSGDLYGIGLVLFELTSGPLPYEKYSVDSVGSRLERGQRGPRNRDLQYEPNVPARLRAVINKAIRRDPADRFQSCHEMSAALARVALIDWSLTFQDDDHRTWTGASVSRPDRIYRVEAERKRSGVWRLSGQQRVSQWRRAVSDRVVSDIRSPDSAAFFESILALASRR